MKCEICSRMLKSDSKYCDFCGSKQPERVVVQEEKSVLDIKFLLMGIALSIIISLIFSLIFAGAGLPVFFGGLFLPFFFKKKKITK